MAALRELVSLILSQRLDRDRPLWQLNLVTGLPADRWALVSKVHHCLIDGVSGTDLLAVLVDDATDDAAWSPSWDPRSLPTPRDVVRQALLERALDPTEQYRVFRANAKRGRREWSRLTRREVTMPTDPTGLTGPVGPRRSWAPAVVGMRAVRALRDRHGVSTHDVVLALVTSGLRALALARHEGPHRQPDVRAVVPMAVAADRAAFTGGIAASIVELPAGEPDLDRQLHRIHHQSAPDTAGGVAGSALTRLPGFAAPALASLGLREAARTGKGIGDAQAVVVNVPGPSRELTVLRRPMIETYPVMPLPPRVRVTVGVVSYADRFAFGVTTDRDALPDGQVVATGIERAAAAIMAER
jgi:WS/DGAT/MGAT family acyltransferase